MPVHYSDRCLSILNRANMLAQSLRRTSVGTEHVLWAMLEDGDGAAAALLRQAGVLPEGRAASRGKLPWCLTVERAADLAAIAARSRGHLYVGNRHLLLGILQQHDTVAAHVIVALGAEREALCAEALTLVSSEQTRGTGAMASGPASAAGTRAG